MLIIYSPRNSIFTGNHPKVSDAPGATPPPPGHSLFAMMPCCLHTNRGEIFCIDTNEASQESASYHAKSRFFQSTKILWGSLIFRTST